MKEGRKKRKEENHIDLLFRITIAIRIKPAEYALGWERKNPRPQQRSQNVAKETNETQVKNWHLRVK